MNLQYTIYRIINKICPSRYMSHFGVKDSKDGSDYIYHKERGTIALMCPHCYRIDFVKIKSYSKTYVKPFDTTNAAITSCPSTTYSRGTCPDCLKSVDSLIPIDVSIAKAISIFNKKGYKTNFCCEGHGVEEGYIAFELTEKNVNMLKNKVPDYWYYDATSNTEPIMPIIRFNCNHYKNAMKSILNYARELRK